MTAAGAARSRRAMVFGALCAGVAVVAPLLFGLGDPSLMVGGVFLVLLSFFLCGALSWRLLVEGRSGGSPIRGAIAGAATGLLAIVICLLLIAILLALTEGAGTIPAMLMMVAPLLVALGMPVAMLACALIGWLYARRLRATSSSPS